MSAASMQIGVEIPDGEPVPAHGTPHKAFADMRVSKVERVPARWPWQEDKWFVIFEPYRPNVERIRRESRARWLGYR